MDFNQRGRPARGTPAFDNGSSELIWSPRIRAELSQLEAATEELQLRLQVHQCALSSVQHLLSRSIAELAQQHNALRPFHRLPTEIVVEIFRISAADHQERGSPLHQIMLLRCVSATWRAIIDSTPALWTTITTAAPSVLVTTALEKSNGLHIHVVHHQQSYNARLDNRSVERGNQHTSAVFHDLLENVHRWASTDILAWAPTDLEKICTVAAPALTSLKAGFSSYQGLEDDSAFNLFLGDAPQLESIELEAIPALWSSQIFSGLKTLKLIRLHSSSGLSIDRIQSILGNCPGLQSLRLDFSDWHAQDRDGRSEESNPTVTLNDLHTIQLRLPATQLLRILPYVHAPTCRVFLLSTMEVGTMGSTLSDVMALVVPFLNTCLDQSIRPHLVAEVGARSVLLKIQDQAKANPTIFSFDIFRLSQLSSPLEWLAEQLRLFGERFVASTVVYSAAEGVENVLKALNRLPRVTTLELNHAYELSVTRGQVMDSVLSYLSATHASPDGEQWPFSQLETLIIGTKAVPQSAMERMLRLRYAPELGGADEEGMVQVPSPLKLLKFKHLSVGKSGVTPSLVEAIRSRSGGVEWGDDDSDDDVSDSDSDSDFI